MKKKEDSFTKGRIGSIKFAFRGIRLLIATENNIKVQVICAFLVTILGFLLDISRLEWGLQFLAIGLVLVAEAINTAIEKVADFIHPEYHEKIGIIKDISAGAPAFAAIISIIIAALIYVPRIIVLF